MHFYFLKNFNIIRSICVIPDNQEKFDGKTVRKRLLNYIRSTKPKSSLAKKVLSDVGRYTRRWIKNLFHTYDYPCIPRTNNAMETFIGRLKRRIRRATGWRFSNDFCVRWDKFLVHVMCLPPRAILGTLEDLSWEPVSRRYRQFCCYLGSIGLSAYTRSSLRDCDYNQYLKTVI